MGGMRWNSRLPKKGAGRPKGARDGDANPGIKGGQKRRNTSQKRNDPLYIPGKSGDPMAGQPEFLTVDDVIHGARAVQTILSKGRWENRIEDVLEKVYEAAVGRVSVGEKGTAEERVVAKEPNMKAAELLLQYKFGKPVTLNENINRDLTADEIAATAEQVGRHLKLVKDESA